MKNGIYTRITQSGGHLYQGREEPNMKAPFMGMDIMKED